MPQSLVDRIKAARTFNQGYALTEYLASALLDMAWHTQTAEAQTKDVSIFEASALDRFHIHLAEVPPRYHTAYFAHIWSGGYSAGYYAYLWSEVLDHDAYAWFKAHGDLTRANGDRFRQMILSKGSTEDTAAMYRAFRGQDPSVEPLIEARGMKAAEPKR
jgi:peptidyl-dipeptidase Dcp